MSKTTKNTAPKKEDKSAGQLLFRRENYLLMLASVLIITVGFSLMTGTEDIFSTTKITVAPLTVLFGFVVGVFAIFFRKKEQNGDN